MKWKTQRKKKNLTKSKKWETAYLLLITKLNFMQELIKESPSKSPKPKETETKNKQVSLFFENKSFGNIANWKSATQRC